MVERSDINGVLMQMRALKMQAQQQIPAVNFSVDQQKVKELEKSEFGDLFKNAIDKVNEAQKMSKAMATAYQKGDETVDLTQVMVAAQKSSVAFEAMAQVRNRLVSAYEDIMKMPI